MFLLQTLNLCLHILTQKNAPRTHVKPSILYSTTVTIDSDGILSREITVQAPSPTDIMDRLDHSMLELTPQRKGWLPQYSCGQLELLQAQFNELESMGVFRKPEDVGVTVEYLNPSFLVKKGSLKYVYTDCSCTNNYWS